MRNNEADLYSSIAKIYDLINADIDYEAWADEIEAAFGRYCMEKPELVLDMGCGSGSMTFALAKRGYDMTALDLSEDMLAVARDRAESELGAESSKKILFLNQDMTDFELYGTVDAAVCCLDGINYLTSKKELAACLACVHNYLIPGGVFLFDVNAPYKYRNIYADRCYTYDYDSEDGNLFCSWQNDYNPKTGLCDFYLTVFSEGENGYERCDEFQRQRRYTEQALKSVLTDSGFEILAFCGGEEVLDGFSTAYQGFNLPKTAPRWFIAARAMK